MVLFHLRPHYWHPKKWEDLVLKIFSSFFKHSSHKQIRKNKISFFFSSVWFSVWCVTFIQQQIFFYWWRYQMIFCIIHYELIKSAKLKNTYNSLFWMNQILENQIFLNFWHPNSRDKWFFYIKYVKVLFIRKVDHTSEYVHILIK